VTFGATFVLITRLGIQWDNDQWVSYDDEETFKQKREFANSRCLGMFETAVMKVEIL
jgi:hypothetical protein